MLVLTLMAGACAFDSSEDFNGTTVAPTGGNPPSSPMQYVSPRYGAMPVTNSPNYPKRYKLTLTKPPLGVYLGGTCGGAPASMAQNVTCSGDKKSLVFGTAPACGAPLTLATANCPAGSKCCPDAQLTMGGVGVAACAAVWPLLHLTHNDEKCGPLGNPAPSYECWCRDCRGLNWGGSPAVCASTIPAGNVPSCYWDTETNRCVLTWTPEV
jgi:hypothetical protein